MAIRNLRYDTDPFLRKRSLEVEKVDAKIQKLVADMFETMYSYDGVGLSAVQVGVLKRVIVVDTREENEKVAIINPKIVTKSNKKEFQEGCLSFPDIYATVERESETVVEGLDINGNKITVKAKGIFAEALLHEIDHLNGVLFVDIAKRGTFVRITGNKDIPIDDVVIPK